MPRQKRTPRKELKSAIKTLIVHEIRLMQMEKRSIPSLLLDELIHTLREAKQKVIELAYPLDEGMKISLIKRMMQETLDEEIDQAIERRRNRCFRCVNMRYYDRSGIPHTDLPLEPNWVERVGCITGRTPFEEVCYHFIERLRTPSLGDYFNEVTLLYELREMFEQLDEIWKDYFFKD